MTGFGGSCENGETSCYVDKDANCADLTQLLNGKTISKNACKGKGNKDELLYCTTQEWKN